MTTTEARPGPIDRSDTAVVAILSEEAQLDGERVLDLAQFGFSSVEIAETLGVDAASIDRALESLVPGGLGGVRTALRRRLRAWREENPESTWLDAETDFGVLHTHVLRLVRAPREAELLRAEPSDAGFLDLVMSGSDYPDERAAACARAYVMGATLQEIGDRFGVTRERIRQILSQYTPWSSTELATALRHLNEARQAEQRRAVEAWSLMNPAAPVAEAAALLGLSEAQVLERLGRRRRRHVPAAPKQSPSTRRPDEMILEDLRAYQRATGSTTAAGFTEWAREQNVPGPQTAAIRFGTWNDALREAGLSSEGGAIRKTISDDDLWAAAIAAVRAPDGGTTARAVEDWLSTRDAAPSIALIRQRLRMPWAEIAATALAVINEDPTLDAEWARRVSAERDWDTAPEQIDPLSHVRDAMAELGPTITTAAYSAWARTHRRPGAPTLQRRTGKKWSELLAEAGGTPNRTKTRGRTAKECLEFVRSFLADHPGGGSAQYAQWASAHEAPSLSTVTSRWGTWNEALELARSPGHL